MVLVVQLFNSLHLLVHSEIKLIHDVEYYQGGNVLNMGIIDVQKIDEEDFQEKRWQLLEWIEEVDQITDSEARSQLVDEIKSMPQEIVEKMYNDYGKSLLSSAGSNAAAGVAVGGPVGGIACQMGKLQVNWLQQMVQV